MQHAPRFLALIATTCLLASGCSDATGTDDDDPVVENPDPSETQEPAGEPRASVAVRSGLNEDGTSVHYAYASFLAEPTPHILKCTQQIGACEVCGINPDTKVVDRVSAGLITIETGGQSFSVQPSMDDPPMYDYSAPGPLWTSSQVVSFFAPGDQAPGFEGSVTTPGHITLLDPVWSVASQGGAPPLSQSSDFVVEWSSMGTAGVVEVLFADDLVEYGDTEPFLRCSFPLADGIGVVPAEALALLEPGPVQVSFSPMSKRKVQASDWIVGLYAFGSVSTTEGEPVSSAMFEIE